VQVLSPHSNVKMPKADMVDLSSSNTEEALELLPLSPTRGYHSTLSNLWSSSDSELFEDWPEVNDMAASVYIALTSRAVSCWCLKLFPTQGPKVSSWCLVSSTIPFTGGFMLWVTRALPR
jgi:hypothetical protein